MLEVDIKELLGAPAMSEQNTNSNVDLPSVYEADGRFLY